MNTVNEADIKDAQARWGQAVASANIDDLMALYHPRATLDPTFSPIVRTTPEDIRLYFVGGDKFSDLGFLKRGIVEVQFVESKPKISSQEVSAEGEYWFILASGEKVKVCFIYTYIATPEGLLIKSHKSWFKDKD